MSDNPINVAGVEIPSDSPVFLAALGAHVLFGLSCVVTGVVAMLSAKRPGRHPRFGTIYYYCLSVVLASATVMSVMRWAEDYHLFIVGTLSFATASLGRLALRRCWRNRIRLHIFSHENWRIGCGRFSISMPCRARSTICHDGSR